VGWVLGMKGGYRKSMEGLVGKLWASNNLESRSADESYIELAQDSLTSQNFLLFAFKFLLLLVKQ